LIFLSRFLDFGILAIRIREAMGVRVAIERPETAVLKLD